MEEDPLQTLRGLSCIVELLLTGQQHTSCCAGAVLGPQQGLYTATPGPQQGLYTAAPLIAFHTYQAFLHGDQKIGGRDLLSLEEGSGGAQNQLGLVAGDWDCLGDP